MHNPLDLAGKTVLVTGASSGIGQATAVQLSRLGARVVLNGRDEGRLQATLASMDEPDAHLLAPFDLANLQELPGWLRETVQRAGSELHGLVHAAGVADTTPLRALSRASIDAVLLPSLYVALTLLRAGSAKGVGADGCSFVLVSSVAALTASPGMVAYSGAKGALLSIARSAAVELARRAMRVNCIAPGYVATPMLERMRSRLPAESWADVERRQFLGLCTPEEVATGVAFLLSDAARRVTGTTLVMDGGYSC